MTIQDRIRQKMEELGLNPTALSKAAGLNQTYVRDLLESDDPNPRLRHLQALASVLGVKIEWLIEGADQNKIADIWSRIPQRDREAAQRMLEGLTRKEGNKA